MWLLLITPETQPLPAEDRSEGVLGKKLKHAVVAS
jgi:hypothetical protein